MRNFGRRVDPIKPQASFLNQSDLCCSEYEDSQFSSQLGNQRERSKDIVRDRKQNLRKIRCDRIRSLLDFRQEPPSKIDFLARNIGQQHSGYGLKLVDFAQESKVRSPTRSSGIRLVQTDSLTPQIDFERRRCQRKGLNLLTRFKALSKKSDAFKQIKAGFVAERLGKGLFLATKSNFLRDLIRLGFAHEELLVVDKGAYKLNFLLRNDVYHAFKMLKYCYFKHTGQLSRLSEDKYCRTIAMAQTLNSLLLKKGLFTILEVVEGNKAKEERCRLLETSLKKLQIFKNRSKKFVALLRPFRRIGFKAIIQQSTLVKLKEGLEDIDYVFKRALRRKAFACIGKFDSIAYLRRKMHEQEFEAFSHKKQQQKPDWIQSSIPRVTVFTQSRVPEQSASPVRVRVQRASSGPFEDEVLRRTAGHNVSHHTIVEEIPAFETTTTTFTTHYDIQPVLEHQFITEERVIENRPINIQNILQKYSQFNQLKFLGKLNQIFRT